MYQAAKAERKQTEKTFGSLPQGAFFILNGECMVKVSENLARGTSSGRPVPVPPETGVII